MKKIEKLDKYVIVPNVGFMVGLFMMEKIYSYVKITI